MKSEAKCQVCNKTNWKLYFERTNFSLLRCSKCNFVKTIKKGFIEINDEQYTDPKEPLNQFKNKKLIYEQAATVLLNFLKNTPKNSSLLDVGCGLGWLLKQAAALGYNAQGIDSSVTFVKAGRKLLGVKSRVKTLEELNTNKKYDVIVMSHVIEHVEDHKIFLKKTRELLKPNGKLLIACPNIDSILFKIQKDKWFPLSPGVHLWQFSKRTLSRLLKNNGFKIEKITTTNLYHDEHSALMSFYFSLSTLLDKGDQIVCIATRK
jgi:2-polyprenyl-3-methyl-5-hydroxy-6-metoxy-1,4-benzoquinol methylase